jgi:hypothetical protein
MTITAKRYTRKSFNFIDTLGFCLAYKECCGRVHTFIRGCTYQLDANKCKVIYAEVLPEDQQQ